jgi:hypothetical protein
MATEFVIDAAPKPRNLNTPAEPFAGVFLLA